MRRLLDALLTREAGLRTRLVQALLVVLALVFGAVALLVLAAIGQAPRGPVLVWVALVPLASLGVYAAVRSGYSRRFDDPSLSLLQLVIGGLACAAGYALAGPARGGFFFVLMVVLLATLLSAPLNAIRWGSAFALVALGAAMLHTVQRGLASAAAEALQFLLAVALVPAVAMLARRLAAMRALSRRQQQDLEGALSRIRELATRDELTGLINRRHVRELMEQEHQRCIRSGHTFCLAVLDIDRFRQVNDRHGRGIGDAVLRSVAHEALRRVRASDAFARWSGDRFLLLMTDTRGPLARGGGERVRSGIAGAPLAVPGGELRITLSAGLAEHHAGETVEQTLERAERALDEAKQQGRDRLVAAN